MGILIAQMRLAQINSYRADLEYKIQLVSTTKLELSAQINDMVGFGTDMDPNSPEMKALEKRKERLMAVEKQLDQQLQRYQTQLQMIESEEQSVQKQLDSSIERLYA